MIYITNRPPHGDKLVTQVSPGIHVLSNANLDSPWPKVSKCGPFLPLFTFCRLPQLRVFVSAVSEAEGGFPTASG